MHLELARDRQRHGSIEESIAHTLKLGRVTMNEIDLDDLMLKQSVMRSIDHLSKDILKGYLPPRLPGSWNDPETEAVDMATLMEEFKERAFWVAETGVLIICASVGDDYHLIQVPKGSWIVRDPGVCH